MRAQALGNNAKTKHLCVEQKKGDNKTDVKLIMN